MRHFNRKDFEWKKNKLYFGKEEILHIVPHREYKSMFWIESADFSWCSPDFYNKDRAKDNGYSLAMNWLSHEVEKEDTEKTEQERGVPSPVDALN